MKRFILCASLIAYSGNLGAHTSKDVQNVYIENHYGAPIKFKKGTADSKASEIAVNNQKRVLVAKVSDVAHISIRTTGKGSQYVSYFTELAPQIAQINIESSRNKDKDAVILIKPSRSYQNWDIEIRWETQDQKLETLPTDLSDEHDFMKVIDGSLGQDYAEKARAIRDYDYTKATKRGQINLRDYLLSKIRETTTQTYTKHRKPGAPWVAPDLSTTEDLKDSINMIYRTLEKYKTKDNQ